MTVAVVLSSYNGERYIKEQLISLKNQTRKIDKVYICDDGSVDNTVGIIKTFITDNSLDNWSLKINSENKGWKKNFRDMILSADEDIIFPCDQDDIWSVNKIEEMSIILEKRKEIDLLACGYYTKYDDNTRHVSKRITREMKNTGKVKRIKMNENYMNVLRPGCTYAIRKEFCHKIESAWNEELPHDAMIWRCSIINNGAYVYDKKLITWRRYNLSSSNPNSRASQYNDKYKMLYYFNLNNTKSHLLFLNCVESLLNADKLFTSNKNKIILKKSKCYEQMVYNALQSRKVLSYLSASMKYSKYCVSLKSVLWNVFVLAVNKKSLSKVLR